MEQNDPCLFQIGQIVRLKTGKSPQRVVQAIHTHQHGWRLVCQYLSDTQNYELHYRRPRDQHDFVEWSPSWIPEESPFETAETQEKTMTDLYQVKGAVERFGTKLTENSQGYYVLEMKGEGGKVETFHPSMVELVVPYTVQLVCIPPNDSGMHIQCESGKLKKDDILLTPHNGKMFRVAAIDTKNRNPKVGELTFFKLTGENVTIGSDK